MSPIVITRNIVFRALEPSKLESGRYYLIVRKDTRGVMDCILMVCENYKGTKELREVTPLGTPSTIYGMYAVYRPSNIVAVADLSDVIGFNDSFFKYIMSRFSEVNNG